MKVFSKKVCFLGFFVVLMLNTVRADDLIGRKAPIFRLPIQNASQGERFQMDDWLSADSQYAVVVAFFATWCAPCWLELPFLQSVTDSLYDEGLRVVFVSVDNPYGAEQVKMVESLELTGPVIHDRLGIVARRFEFPGTLPYTVYINKKGVVSYISTGYTPEMNDELLEKINSILNQS